MTDRGSVCEKLLCGPPILNRRPVVIQQGTTCIKRTVVSLAIRVMIDRKPYRVVRELTAPEREILQAARADAEAEQESILEQAREAKNAWQETRQVVDLLIAELKAERERQALSLADVEERTGIRRSVLSRLENDATSNPTMLTLQRYAVALGLSLPAELTNAQ